MFHKKKFNGFKPKKEPWEHFNQLIDLEIID